MKANNAKLVKMDTEGINGLGLARRRETAVTQVEMGVTS